MWKFQGTSLWVPSVRTGFASAGEFNTAGAALKPICMGKQKLLPAAHTASHTSLCGYGRTQENNLQVAKLRNWTLYIFIFFSIATKHQTRGVTGQGKRIALSLNDFTKPTSAQVLQPVSKVELCLVGPCVPLSIAGLRVLSSGVSSNMQQTIRSFSLRGHVA